MSATAPETRTDARGFRPSSRRRARVAIGAALVAVAVGGNLLVYSSLDDRTEVVQLVADVRAGDRVTADALRIVEVDLDPTIPVVPADEVGTVVDSYARVHLVSGTLLSPVLVQTDPLVADGAAVVAIELRPSLVPDGIRERSLVELVVTGDDETVVSTGRVVSRPRPAEDVTGVMTMSVELTPDAARIVAAADDIRVVLLDPGTDPVYGAGG